MSDPKQWSNKWLCRIAVIWDFIERRQVVRRLSAVWIMVLTTVLLYGTIDFAWNSPRPGIDVAAIIASVWTPLSALQGYVFRFFDEVPHVSSVPNGIGSQSNSGAGPNSSNPV